MQSTMQSTCQQSSNSSRRKIVYGLALVLFCLMGLSGVWFADGVLAEGAGPLGETIPPGGTVPPAPDPVPNQGQVNIIHVAPFADEVIDTGVQICDMQGKPVTSYLYYQQQTQYLELYMGEYDWVVTMAGSNCADPLPGLVLPTIKVYDGTRLTLLLIGDNANSPFDSMVLVEQVGRPHYHLPIMAKD